MELIGDRALVSFGQWLFKNSVHNLKKGEEEMWYIGIDLGTSAVKLLLMNEKGDIKKIVS